MAWEQEAMMGESVLLNKRGRRQRSCGKSRWAKVEEMEYKINLMQLAGWVLSVRTSKSLTY
jgi:hypothetical protein